MDELNAIVDEIARLSLARIRLASNVLNLPADQRDDVGQIETADTAITLARVKISAARRQILRQSQDDTTSRAIPRTRRAQPRGAAAGHASNGPGSLAAIPRGTLGATASSTAACSYRQVPTDSLSAVLLRK